MQTFNQYRMLALGLCISLLLLIFPFMRTPAGFWHGLFFGEAASSSSMSANAVYAIKHHHAVKTVVHPKKAPVVIHSAPVERELNMIHLNTMAHEYTAIFSGKVTCDDQPCAADLVVNIQTTRNENLHRTFRAMPDGTFSIQIPVLEVPHEQMDWKILARAPSQSISERHGQQILVEDPLSVESDIQIQ